MPAAPRKEVFDPDSVGVYHCTTRCSQGARLCGVDPVMKTDFSHRKQWVRDRLKEIAGLMAIDVLDYAVLDNHLHVVLRNRPDLVAQWNDAEVVRRWWYLCPERREADGTAAEPRDVELDALRRDPGRVAEYRARLSNISWLMRLLCQPIARRANRESNVTGRFFAHRFWCRRLIDERALLACSMYVDLNLVRAGMAKTPETSVFTSAYDRIRGRWQRMRREMGEPLEAVAEQEDQDAWLAPLLLDERAAATSPMPAVAETPSAAAETLSAESEALSAAAEASSAEKLASGAAFRRPFPSPRASDKGFLPMTLNEYLALLDWTGRQIRSDKRGAIPKDLAPILERLQIAPEHWIETVDHFGRLFRTAAGGLEAMRGEAQRRGRRWLSGVRNAAVAFASVSP